VKETSANELLTRHLNRSAPVVRDEHGDYLPIGHVVSVVQAALCQDDAKSYGPMAAVVNVMVKRRGI
jgi:hypothetical protein